MKLFYPKEHQTCPNYDKNIQPEIEVRSLRKDQSFTEQSTHGKIIIIKEGCLDFFLGISNKGVIHSGQLLFLPPGQKFELDATADTLFLIIRLEKSIRFCECYPMERLTLQTEEIFSGEGKETERITAHLLNANMGINSYTEGLLMAIERGLRCKNFFAIKVRELFYLFRAFYTKEELALFFKELLAKEAHFSYLIMHNYQKYKTASEFAVALNMTLWTFEKQFKKTFGMPAYRWMKEQKAREIYNEICSGRKSFKELSFRFGFASKSSFSEFCSKNLGAAPGQIRKKVQTGKDGKQKQ